MLLHNENLNTGDWCYEEFASLDIGDIRLDDRLRLTASKLAELPQASILQACGDWKTAKGAYRLFDNRKITSGKILEPHRQKTVERMKAHPVVLAVQDTTYFTYHTHRHGTAGLGNIGVFKKDKVFIQGLIMHHSFIITPQGVSLGILSQKIWARKNKKRIHRQKRPLTDRESIKWFECLDETLSYAPKEPMVVTIADREADIFEFLDEIKKRESHFLIRANWNRVTRKDTRVASLWNQIEAEPVVGTYEVEVSETKNNKTTYRKAKMSVRYAKITILPPVKDSPYLEKRNLKPIEIYGVLAKEETAPSGFTPAEWLLLTNVSVESIDDAFERIHWYEQRWQVENFHKILKSGCSVEQLELESAERLKKAITLYSIIAWRLHWITHIGRQQPEAPCTVAFEDHEWKTLYYRNNVDHPKHVPNLAQVIRWLAQLGGFLGRKGDGEPGIKSIWRGWQRLTDLAAGWVLGQCCRETYG